MRARAIENQAFVIAANQFGAHPGGPALRRALDDRRPVGDRARAGAPTARDTIVAELDLERQREIRARLPSLANRRPEAYRWPQERH